MTNKILKQLAYITLLLFSPFLNAQTIGGIDLNSTEKIKSENYFRGDSCEAVNLFTTETVWPSGVARQGNAFWIAGIGESIIYKVDLNGNALAEIDISNVGSSSTIGGALHYDGTYLWSYLEQAGLLLQLDPDLLTLIAEYDLPSDDNGSALAGNDEFLWHCEYNFGGNFSTLFKLDIATFSLIESFEIPYGSVLGLKHIGNNKLKAVSRAESNTVNYLLEIDGDTGEVLLEDSLCVPLPSDIEIYNDSIFITSASIQSGGEQSIFYLGQAGLVSNVSHSLSPCLTVFPNPVKDNLYLDFSCVELQSSIVNLYDARGQLMLSRNLKGEQIGTEVIGIDQLSPGVYFLKIAIENEVYSKKILITK